MAETLSELGRLSDDDLVNRHDEIAPHVAVGTQHYIAELRHREGARREARMVDLTAQVVALTRQIRGLTILAVVVAVVALFVAAASLAASLR